MSTAHANEDQWPSVLPGFEQLSRVWDASHKLCATKILPGEYYVTRNNEIVTTVLGSCVSACIRDPMTCVGGMNHFMLPGDTAKSLNKWGGEESLATRYGIAAMENLINDILKQGARKDRLEVKLFGGGKVLAMDINDVGKRNIDFAKQFVTAEGLSVASEDLGGPHPRKVHYFPRTGKVMIRRLRALQNQTIADKERQYEHTLSGTQNTGEIELFG